MTDFSKNNPDTFYDEHYANCDPIAVVGMACRFPQADNIEQYWQGLLNNTRFASHFTREQLLAAGVNEATVDKDNFVPVASVIESPENFDATLFGYSPQEAESIDPQQRLFLQVVWHALEHAGYAPRNITQKTGVYGSARISTYPSLNNFSVTDVGQVKGMQALLGNDKDYLATRVAHRFNLHGPALTVQTACSSSLVAVHMACESLRGGECDMAIAGGAAVSFPQHAGYLYQPGMVFSPDGFCRPFSENAEGTFGGNGVGAVVLKRLEDALNDGDPIMAVLRGSAINNDGSDKVGFTAPSVAGQQHVLTEALHLADVDPGQIGMVEAHGTGTTLGDPIEIAALQAAYRGGRDTAKACYIGSVKSNLGHLDTAAGIASLMKTILAVHHAAIPASLHVDKVNPKLQLDSSRFAIASEQQSWRESLRTAGVSSFGIGGTNCHMIVQSLPEELRAISEDAHVAMQDHTQPVLLLSAASLYSLQQLASKYASHLQRHTIDAQSVKNVAYTALHGRQLDLPYRLAMMLDSDTVDTLSDFSDRDDHTLTSTQKLVCSYAEGEPTQAWLFTGQGCHYAGMGRDWYAISPAFAESIDYSVSVCRDVIDVDLKTLMFADDGKHLHRADYAQLAIVVFEIAMSAHWQSMGLIPDVVLGHSVGEYAAAVAAGYLSHEQALLTVIKRGEYVAECADNYPDSGMVAVFSSADELVALSALQALDLAVINGDKHYVYSGPAELLTPAIAELQAQGINHKVLTVPCAMHSKILDDVLKKYEKITSSLTIAEGSIPLISSLYAREVDSATLQESTATGNYWTEHLRQTVQFKQALDCALEKGVSLFVEMGPQPHLSGIGRREYNNHNDVHWLAAATPKESAPVQQQHLLCELFTKGCLLHWTTHLSFAGRKCHAPLYPFDEQAYWCELPEHHSMAQVDARYQDADHYQQLFSSHINLDALDLTHLQDAKVITQRHHELQSQCLQVDSFVRHCIDDAIDQGATVGNIIRGGRLLPRYRDQITWLLEQCVNAGIYHKRNDRYYSLEPATTRTEDVQGYALFNQLRGKLATIAGVSLTSSIDTHYQWSAVPVHMDSSVAPVFGLLHSRYITRQGLLAAGIQFDDQETTGLIILDNTPLLELALNLLEIIQSSICRRWVIVTCQAYYSPEHFTSNIVNPDHYAVAALLRCAALDKADDCEIITVDIADVHPTVIFNALSHFDSTQASDIIYRDNTYWQRQLQKAETVPLSELTENHWKTAAPGYFKQDGWHIVTGGMGGIGRLCVRWLAQKGARHIAVIGRRCHQDWDDFVAPIVEQFNSEVIWQLCDLSVSDDLIQTLDNLQEKYPIKGIIHAAGIADHTDIDNIDKHHLVSVVNAKAVAAKILCEKLQQQNADYALLFSSAAVLGAPGQGAYALANAYLDGLALENMTAANHHSQETHQLRISTISWGAWREVGMTTSQRLIEQLAHSGMYTLEAAEGLWHIEQALTGDNLQHRFAMRVDISSPSFGHYFASLLNTSTQTFVDVTPSRGVTKEDKKTAVNLSGDDDYDRPVVATWLSERIAYQLRLDKKTILNEQQDLLTMGMDSLLFLELSNDIKKTLGVSLSADAVYDDFTIAGLCQLILSKKDKLSAESSDSIGENKQSYDVIIDQQQRHLPFPLTPIQHAYWIGRTDLLDYGSVACQVVFEWDKSLNNFDVERFEQAWNALIQRHDMLRMVVDNDGEQRILSDVPLYRLERRSVAACSDHEKQQQLLDFRKRLCEQVRPADIWPLFELSLTQLDEAHVRLHMSLDLLQFDVQSFKIMMDDLTLAYQGAQLPHVQLSFRDYVMYEQQQRNSAEWQASWHYWQDMMPLLPDVPQLPMAAINAENTIHPAPEFFTLSGGLEKSQWQQLKQHWQQWGITPSAGLMALFAHVLACFTRQPQFTLNMTFFNRQNIHSDVQQLIGDFTSIMLMDFDTQAAVSLRDGMQKTQNKLWQNLSHSRINGVEVLRSFSRHLQSYEQNHNEREQQTLTPVVFTSMLGMSMEGLDIEQALTRFLGDPVFVHSQTPQVWLDHQIMEVDDALAFHWYCMRDVLADGVLDNLFSIYQTLLSMLAKTPELMTTTLRGSVLDLMSNSADNVPSRPQFAVAEGHAIQDAWPLEQQLRQLPQVQQAQLFASDDSSNCRALFVANSHYPTSEMRTLAMTIDYVQTPISETDLQQSNAAWKAIECRSLAGLCKTLLRHRVFEAINVEYTLDNVIEKLQAQPQYRRLLKQWLDLLCREAVLSQKATTQNIVYTANHRFFAAATSDISEVPNAIWCQQIDEYVSRSIALHDDLLQGKASALELLFGNEWYIKSLYEINPALRFLNHHAASIVDLLAQQSEQQSSQKKPFRMLEIGAGTAATTRSVLAAAGSRISDYYFTDVSNLFLDDARESLDDHAHQLHFDLLDINQPINFSQHPQEGYDVILGVNVLNHATHVQYCLNRLRSILKPGGHLVIIEATDRHSAMQLATLAFLESTEVFEDFRAQDYSAMLDHTMWQQALVEAGFEPRVSVPDVDISPLRQHLLLAQSVRGGRVSIDELLSASSLANDILRIQSFEQVERLPINMTDTQQGLKIDDVLSAEVVKHIDGVTAEQSGDAADDDLIEIVRKVWQQLLQHTVENDSDFFRSGGDSVLATRMVVALQKEGVQQANLQPLFDNPLFIDFCRALSESDISTPQGVSEQQQDDVVKEHQNIMDEVLNDETVIPPFPLTDLQRAYWLGEGDVFELSNGVAHFYAELSIPSLDEARFTQAWNNVIQQHPQMRGFINNASEFCILPHVDKYQPRCYDLCDLNHKQRQLHLENARKNIRQKGVPSHQWPLFDISIHHLPDNESIVHIVLDLVLADGSSVNLMFSQLAAWYQNMEQKFPVAELSIRDYLLKIETHKTSEKYQKSQQYWFDRIDSMPDAPQLPVTDGDRKDMDLQSLHYIISGEKWQQLQTQSFSHNLTPSSVMLTLFCRILAQWSETSHFSINILHRNRIFDCDPDNLLVGNLSTTNILEVLLEPGKSLVHSAQTIQEQLFNDLQHADFNGQQVLREINQRKHKLAAGMPVVFNDTVSVSQRQQMKLGELKEFGVQTPHVYLDCMLIAAPNGGVAVKWAVQKNYLQPDVADTMFESFVHTIERVIHQQHDWLAPFSLPLPVSQVTQRQLINATTLHHKKLLPPNSATPMKTLCQLVENGVKCYPKRCALVSTEGSLTYQQLWKRACLLALQLLDSDKPLTKLVAVVMDKGWEQVVATVAIHLAGKAYLPIDAQYPEQRIHELLEQGGVSHVLTQHAVIHRIHWPASLDVMALTSLSEPVKQRISTHNRERLDKVAPVADDVAYVIFTSGSTGKPKGVVITHHSAVNTLLDVNQRIDLCKDDVVLGISSLSFDLSVFDIFSTLAAGAKLVVPQAQDVRDPAVLAEWVVNEKVTIWNSVPAFAQMLQEYVNYHDVEYRSAVDHLRWVMMSGDWIPVQLPEKLTSLNPNVNVLSMGGATEAAIWSIAYLIETVDSHQNSIPYGCPMANQSFFIYNELMDPCPTWVAGELYISGIGLAQGYWEDEEKTSAAFITHPYTGERLYKTGDLGRYLPDGNIEFLGRNDHQVKVNGYRVELGEIENSLSEYDHVQDALVQLVDTHEGVSQLVAYIVFEKYFTEKDHEKIIESLRDYIKQKLPAYMCPRHFMALDAVPYSRNGKVDRKALPQPHITSILSEFTAPKTDIEKRVAVVWQEILKQERIDINTSFFDLGGDSFLAVHLLAKINGLWTFRVNAGVLQANDTIADLAAYLEQNSFANDTDVDIKVNDCLVALNKNNHKNQQKTRVFVVHPIGGHLLSYQYLARHLSSNIGEDNVAIYGLQFPQSFVNDPHIDTWSVNDLASYYRQAIQSQQAGGPYHIVGWSFGGILAYEIARQLQKEGEQIANCILIDSFVPTMKKDLVIDEALLMKHFLIDISGRFPQLIDYDSFEASSRQAFIQQLLHKLSAIPDLVNTFNEEELITLLNIYCGNLQAMLSYHIKPVDFDLVLIRACNKYSNDFMSYLQSAVVNHKNYGWEDYANVSTYDFSGDHYSVFLPGEVEQLASLLADLVTDIRRYKKPQTSSVNEETLSDKDAALEES